MKIQKKKAIHADKVVGTSGIRILLTEPAITLLRNNNTFNKKSNENKKFRILISLQFLHSRNSLLALSSSSGHDIRSRHVDTHGTAGPQVQGGSRFLCGIESETR
jgi:hypothetical protein